jgi:uncharacterized protein (DUF2147 family)
LSGQHFWAIDAGDLILNGEWRGALAMRWAKLVMTGLLTGLAAVVVATHSVVAQEPSAVGLWQKIDTESQKPVVWFLFSENEGTYQGVIAKMFPRPGDKPNPTCSSCRDDRKDQPLLGLPLIRDMKPNGQNYNGLAYEGGNILDPRDGNVYNAMMTLAQDNQSLTVRGYLGIALFGRDEIWYRLPETAYKELDPIIVAKYLPGQTATGSIAMKHKPAPAKAMGYAPR